MQLCMYVYIHIYVYIYIWYIEHNVYIYIYVQYIYIHVYRWNCLVETVLVKQDEFQTGHQTKLFLEKVKTSRICVALKTINS